MASRIRCYKELLSTCSRDIPASNRRLSSARRLITGLIAAALVALWATAGAQFAHAQECEEEAPLSHYTGVSQVVCPCFVVGEQAGSVFDAPADHYPIEILRIGIGWASQTGGAAQQIEQGIHIYAAGLPNPGTPVFTLPGPVLSDGYINEFDLEPLAGEITIDSGPFSTTLEFLNDNAGDFFAPSTVHDGNGCQAGLNLVYATPGSWHDACTLGVTGDWVFYVVYRQVNCNGTGIGNEHVITSGAPAFLMPPSPNPFASNTRIDFLLGEGGRTSITVYDVTGRRVADVTDRDFSAGRQSVSWDGTGLNDVKLPSGMYFVELRTGSFRTVKKVLLTK